MAFIGMKHPVFAPITSAPAGSLPTYGAGIIVGKAMSAKVDITLNDSKLYADDGVAESDKGFQSGKITVGVDDLSQEAILAWFGSLAATIGGVEVVRDAASYNAPEGGYGYYRVRRKGGVRTVRAFWYFRTQWGLPSEEAKTKEEAMEWQTPTAEGDIMTVDDSIQSWRMWKDFAYEADAVAWLNELANIGEPASLTNLNADITTASGLDSETYTSASWVALANALADAQAVAAMESPSQARVDDAEDILEAAIAALVEREA